MMIDNRDFFVGTNTYDKTTLPTGEIKITASDGAAGYQFGYSVAVENDKIVVGAYSENGGAYIFDLDGNELDKITPSDAGGEDGFGPDVAIGSSRIVVGGGPDGDGGIDSGSAYIFGLNGNELKKLTARDAAPGDQFGSTVAVGSGRIVVGARLDDDNGTSSGSVYIFDLDGNQLSKVTASDGAAGDWFGYSVAVGSGRIIVSARLDDNGVNTDSGSVYIFDLDGNQIDKITASDGSAGDQFGWSVAVGSGRIVVGARKNNDGANGTDSGSVYIFDLDGNQIDKITASDGAAGDEFGWTVAVGSGRIVVGAPLDDAFKGSIYIFDLDGNELDKITASDGATGDVFGWSISVGSGRIVVGAYGDSDLAGSAYIYSTPNQDQFLNQLD